MMEGETERGAEDSRAVPGYTTMLLVGNDALGPPIIKKEHSTGQVSQVLHYYSSRNIQL